MCFDSNGNGQQTLASNDGKTVCSGEITAEFQSGGNLQFTMLAMCLARITGLTAVIFLPAFVQCAVSDTGRAECDGWQPEFGTDRRDRFYLKRK